MPVSKRGITLCSCYTPFAFAPPHTGSFGGWQRNGFGRTTLPSTIVLCCHLVPDIATIRTRRCLCFDHLDDPLLAPAPCALHCTACTKTVLLRQQEARGPGGGATEACRVVAASKDLSAKLTALAVVEGTCLDVSLNTSLSLSLSKAAAGSGGGVQGNGGENDREDVGLQPQRLQNSAGVPCQISEKKVAVGEPRGGEILGRRFAKTSAAAMNGSSSTSGGQGRMTAPPLRVQRPVRGFHLVDLHAVVRNSVEWRQCLPKVSWVGGK